MHASSDESITGRGWRRFLGGGGQNLRVRKRRWIAVVATAAVAAVGVGLGVRALFRTVSHPPPSCRVGTGPTALVLAPDQAADAATIAVVAKRLGLPDHAVTIAL